jgi:hypothetical protein
VRWPPPRLISIISAGFTRVGGTTVIRHCSRGEQIAMASMREIHMRVTWVGCSIGSDCGLVALGVYEEDGLNSKNGHLHNAPETAPRRINSLAELAGSRIHIGNIYIDVILALRSKIRPEGSGCPPGPSTQEKTSRYSDPSEPMRSVR